MKLYHLADQMDVLLSKMGINASTAYYKHAAAAMITQAKDAEQIPAASLTLAMGIDVAIAMDNERYVRISPAGVESIPNGQEIFFDPQADHWVYTESTAPDIVQFLIDFINGLLPVANDLTARLIISALLAALSDAHAPMLLFTGLPGSGKTTLIEALLCLIYGSKASVHKIPNKESDLMVTLDHERILGIDNLEAAPEWFHDLVCIAVTGGRVTRRKLYTDKGTVNITLKNLLLMSAVDPVSIYRADVLSRMIVIDCVKAPTLKAPHQLRSYVADNRDAVLSALVDLIRIHMHAVQVPPAHRLVEWHQHAICLGVSADEIRNLITDNDSKTSSHLPLVDVIIQFRALTEEKGYSYPFTGVLLHSDLQKILAECNQQASLKHVPDTWRKMASIVRQHETIFKNECGLELVPSGKNVALVWNPLPN